MTSPRPSSTSPTLRPPRPLSSRDSTLRSLQGFQDFFLHLPPCLILVLGPSLASPAGNLISRLRSVRLPATNGTPSLSPSQLYNKPFSIQHVSFSFQPKANSTSSFIFSLACLLFLALSQPPNPDEHFLFSFLDLLWLRYTRLLFLFCSLGVARGEEREEGIEIEGQSK